jgi:hypothetical protein
MKDRRQDLLIMAMCLAAAALLVWAILVLCFGGFE